MGPASVSVTPAVGSQPGGDSIFPMRSQPASHWMDKPSLLNQFCYVWKANLGQKMSCEIVLFLFMARLWCMSFFCLCRHIKSSDTMRKWQHSLNAKGKESIWKDWNLHVFFLMWRRNFVYIYLFILLGEPVWVPESALIFRNPEVTSPY